MAARVTVLGTGIMGAPMARNLLKAGFLVRVWNRTPEKARVLTAEGAELAETPADAVREAAFVITMLTDTAAVLTVMGQAAESVPDGAVWLQTSIDTDVVRASTRRPAARDARSSWRPPGPWRSRRASARSCAAQRAGRARAGAPADSDRQR